MLVGTTVGFFLAVSFPSSSAAAASALRRFSLALRVFGNCCVFVFVEVCNAFVVFAVYPIRNTNTTDLQSLLL
jgi:hypothetical protein